MNERKNDCATSNPAVAACTRAYWSAYKSASGDADSDEPSVEGELAYGDALPPLLGIRNIRTFIACVAHGSASGMMDRQDVSTLLYAAQIALSSCRMTSKKEKEGQISPKKLKKGPSVAIPEPKNGLSEQFPNPAVAAEASPLQ